MAHVLCLKPMHVISVTGISLELQASMGPQLVPDRVVPELQARGCVECDERGRVLVNGIPLGVHKISDEAAPVDLPQESREAVIDNAVTQVIATGDKTLRSQKDGAPKTFAVSELAGFRVTTVEIHESLKRLGY